jgi:hypothetical protein
MSSQSKKQATSSSNQQGSGSSDQKASASTEETKPPTFPCYFASSHGCKNQTPEGFENDGASCKPCQGKWELYFDSSNGYRFGKWIDVGTGAKKDRLWFPGFQDPVIAGEIPGKEPDPPIPSYW